MDRDPRLRRKNIGPAASPALTKPSKRGPLSTPLAGPQAATVAAHRQRRFMGQNHPRVRDHNIRAILRALLSHGPTSRSALSHLTSLQVGTISSLTRDLIDRGIVMEIKGPAPTGLGRPNKDLDLAPDGVYAFGVHVGMEWIAVGLVSTRGEVHAMQETPRPATLGPLETLSLTTESIRQVLADARIPIDRVLGIGFGVPGVVDTHEGRVIDAEGLGWRDVPVARMLQTAFELPVIVSNNVHAMALAESWLGASRRMADLALLFVGSIVGVGLVSDGQVMRGFSWAAGQIGHTPVAHAASLRCRCGNIGCLETVASIQAIVRDALQSGADLGADLPLQSHPTRPTDPALVDALIDGAFRGEPIAAAVLARAGAHLGAAAAQVITLCNPPLIVLAGRLARAGHFVLRPMRERAKKLAPAELVTSTPFEPSALGADGHIIGPASLILVECFYTSNRWSRVQ